MYCTVERSYGTIPVSLPFVTRPLRCHWRFPTRIREYQVQKLFCSARSLNEHAKPVLRTQMTPTVIDGHRCHLSFGLTIEARNPGQSFLAFSCKTTTITPLTLQ
jgi:hypothetical protein